MMENGSQKDLYCCVAPEFAGPLVGLLERMRGAGYRVLVGNDPQELLLLLELSRPKALLYTLEAQTSKLSSGFRTVEGRALEQGLPLIVVRASDSRAGALEAALWLPRAGSRFEQIPVGIDELPGRLDALEPQVEFAVEPENAAADGGDLFGDRLRDFVKDGEKVLEVETRFVTRGAPRIRTTVSGRHGIVLQEDQPADPLDPDLASKMEAQHMLALAVYRSRDKERVENVAAAYRKDISQPIVLPDVSRESELEGRNKRRPSWVGAVLGAGVVVSLSAALFAMIAPTFERPEVLDRRGVSNSGGGALQRTNPIGHSSSASSEFLLWPPHGGDTEDDSTDVGEAEASSR